MSLKSIRESYSRLLDAFSGAGVKLSESQKQDLDTFVLALESKMGASRRAAIRQTKKAVERRMEGEYRKVFESVMAGMRENARLASMIQDKITQINESRKLSRKVDDYLDLYVESVLPKKTVVDYDRMQKLEKLHESLKDVLLVSEDSVDEKIKALEEEYRVKKSSCETKVARLQVKLDEAMSKARKMQGKIKGFEATQLLESKVKDLPAFEARRVKRALFGATVPEIERKFKGVLESVRRQVNEFKAGDKETIGEEIKEILGGDANEDDMMGRRPHNGYDPDPKSKDDLKKCDPIKDRAHNKHRPVDECDPDVSEQDDVFETIEEVQFDEDGDVKLDEADVIDESLMKSWCIKADRID